MYLGELSAPEVRRGWELYLIKIRILLQIYSLKLVNSPASL